MRRPLQYRAVIVSHKYIGDLWAGGNCPSRGGPAEPPAQRPPRLRSLLFHVCPLYFTSAALFCLLHGTL